MEGKFKIASSIALSIILIVVVCVVAFKIIFEITPAKETVDTFLGKIVATHPPLKLILMMNTIVLTI